MNLNTHQNSSCVILLLLLLFFLGIGVTIAAPADDQNDHLQTFQYRKTAAEHRQ